MAEQFWYTSCSKGLEGTSGLQVRAASPALARNIKELRLAVGNTVNYYLPQGGDAHNTRPEQSPTTLAWVDTAAGRILIHRSFVGFDHDRRPGNFFTHFVSELPQGFNARQAISTWNAAFWQTANPDERDKGRNDLTLEPLDDAKLLYVLAPFAAYNLTELRPKLETVLKAFLSRDPKRRIFIAASPETVALLIWGLTQCLTSGLLNDLTFSTFESDVTKTGLPLITGTCRLEHLAQLGATFNLPAECYAGTNVALNLYPSTRADSVFATDLAISKFTQFAIDSLVNQVSRLERVLRLAETSSSKGVRALTEAYELSSTLPDQWEAPTVVGVLRNPVRAVQYLGIEDFQNRVTALALADVNWWATQAKPALNTLHQQIYANPGLGEKLEQLGSVALSHAVEEVSNGRETYLPTLVDGIAATCFGEIPAVAYGRLLERVTSSTPGLPDANTPINLRVLLLSQWAKLQPPPSQHQIEPWLRVPWDDAEALLAIQMPPEWRDYLADYLISSTPIPQWTIAEKGITSNHALFQDALARQIKSPSGAQSAVPLFQLLWNYNYAQKEKLVVELLACADDTAANELLGIANLDNDQATTWLGDLQKRGLLLKNIERRRNAQQLVSKYLQGLTIEKCKSFQTYQILDSVHLYLTYDDALRRRADAWYAIAKFINYDQFSNYTISGVKDAILFLYPSSVEQRAVVQELASTLARRMTSADTLKIILVSLGEAFEQTSLPLYKRLLEQAKENYRSDSEHRIERFVPYIQVYLRKPHQGDIFNPGEKNLLQDYIRQTLELIDITDRNGIRKLGDAVSTDIDYEASWNTLLSTLGQESKAGGGGVLSLSDFLRKVPILREFNNKELVIVLICLLAVCCVFAAIGLRLRPDVPTDIAVKVAQIFGNSTPQRIPEPTKARLGTAAATKRATARQTRGPTQAPPTVNTLLPSVIPTLTVVNPTITPELSLLPSATPLLPLSPSATLLPPSQDISLIPPSGAYKWDTMRVVFPNSQDPNLWHFYHSDSRYPQRRACGSPCVVSVTPSFGHVNNVEANLYWSPNAGIPAGVDHSLGLYFQTKNGVKYKFLVAQNLNDEFLYSISPFDQEPDWFPCQPCGSGKSVSNSQNKWQVVFSPQGAIQVKINETSVETKTTLLNDDPVQIIGVLLNGEPAHALSYGIKANVIP